MISNNWTGHRNETLYQNASDVNDATTVLTTISVVLFWINMVIDVVGVMGNVVVIVVLAHRKIRCSTSMLLTAMGLYDSAFLIAEFINGVDKIISNETRMAHTHSTALYVAATGSVYTAVAVTVERYMAVKHPIKARAHCYVFGMWKTIIGIFILSLVVNLPRNMDLHAIRIIETNTDLRFNETGNLYTFRNNGTDMKLHTFRINNGTNIDLHTFIGNKTDGDSHMFWFNKTDMDLRTVGVNKTTVIFVDCYDKRGESQHRFLYCSLFPAAGILIVPFAIIAVLNVHIVTIISHRRRKIMSSMTPSSDKGRGLTRVALGITFCFFVFCTFPGVYYITRFVVGYSFGVFDGITESISYTLLVINFSTNFILYCFLGETFRLVCLEMFCCYTVSAHRQNSKTSSVRIGQYTQNSLDKSSI
ncbi:uncharacterized protein LOC121389279 [Gigantopelta aegis]|uniref:uncharacterized protein LOC121389279 n=1 Tax=Gigantopelta aegis TaxID=1735272 RepID=UPI001B88C763|nr:uncharacterized protein LOC121389279 [Gigantopelta aegis]